MQVTDSSILKAYTSERRAYDLPNYQREDLGMYVRYTPLRSDADGIICFTNTPEHEIKNEIEKQCDYFRTKGLSFEWKVYDFDLPSNLIERLLENGFEQGEEEALMVYDLGTAPPQAEKEIEGISIREVSSTEDLSAIVAIQETIWNRSFPWLKDQLLSTKDCTAYFCAFYDELPIGAGWIEHHQDSLFAELHGGSVHPEYRGRGIYSELFSHRLEYAKKKCIPYISVDAAPMSRPILERKGFTKLCSTYPLTKKNAYQVCGHNSGVCAPSA
ncbi:MAG: GNAT family N-acetyltransferase [Verrucomicrobiota bacterium]